MRRFVPSLVVLIFFTGGCVAFKPKSKVDLRVEPIAGPMRKHSYWSEGVGTGEPSIVINMTEQRARFFKGSVEVGQAFISSGKRGYATPTGNFRVIEKDQNHQSNLYGEFVDESGILERNVDTSKQRVPEGASFQGAPMRYFLRFDGATGMHAGRLPGYRASHGCVRMDLKMAKHFFENAPVGTPVTVTD